MSATGPQPASSPGGGIFAWMVRNHVAANILMLSLVIGGLVALSRITQEVFPSYQLDLVNVSVSYPGATPEEVEKAVVLPVEEAVRAIENIEQVTATAAEGSARIQAEVVAGADPDKVLQEIKNEVDRVSSLPDEAERPVISLASRRREVMRVALYGPDDEALLYRLANQVREELIDLPHVTQVEIKGLRKPQVKIEVGQETLRALGLTIEDIAQVVRQRAVDVPGGTVRTSGGEILLRTAGRLDLADEFKPLALVSGRDGAVVRLGDIAKVSEGFEDSTREAYYNGRRAAIFSVYRTGEETPQEISREVKGFAAGKRAQLPAGMGIEVYRDRSELYQQRLDLLLGNGLMGLALVLVCLGLFLEVRLAFWVSMGIPISVIGSFLILYANGGSINMISLFAFIITLGIIVDDAIIVGENIYHKRESGLPPITAAVEGVREMAAPVMVAVATNVIAFIPLLFVPGSTGRFFAMLPEVVIAVFVISLFEALFVLPAHLAYSRKSAAGRLFAGVNRLPHACDRFLTGFVEGRLVPFVRMVVNRRYLVSAAALAVLLMAFAYWDAGWIDFSFRPKIQTDRIDAEIALPFGVPISEVRRVTRLVEEAGMRAVEKGGGREIMVCMVSDIGKGGSNGSEVRITLVDQEHRKITPKDFSKLWREEVGQVPGLERLFFDFLVGPGGSAAINVELSHSDPAVIESAAAEVARELAKYDGVTDIDDGFARGKPQLDFSLLPAGRAAGLSSQALGRQVRHAFYGAEALRQQRGRDEIKVMVMLPESERVSLHDLEGMVLRTPDGGEIPLAEAARVTRSRAYTEIKRVDGRRVLNVTASVTSGRANENKVLASLAADVMGGILARHPGLKYSFQGRSREKREAVKSLITGILMVMPAVFALLAITFRSYVLAAMVMITIPFGLLFALLGHVIMGYGLSIISVFGMIALCGVVVNDGLVYVVCARDLEDGGSKPAEAAVRAAARRFRPIMLTSVTTFFGLAPMIFEGSVQARFLIPMAISLGFGIMFTTLVVVIVLPSLYMIRRDIVDLWGRGR